ncbi:MAG: hypothetical protein ACD_46C00163G0003 [uncultured bacterium]|nr:MAG: hypothetical protein ACD_46C00163G0003 [uncultured bacterium]
MCQLLIYAAFNGNLETVKKYTTKENINLISHLGDTSNIHSPLSAAVLYNQTDIVKYLLEKGAQIQAKENITFCSRYKSALTMACDQPINLEIFKLLLTHTNEINPIQEWEGISILWQSTLNDQDARFNLIFHACVLQNNQNMMNILLSTHHFTIDIDETTIKNYLSGQTLNSTKRTNAVRGIDYLISHYPEYQYLQQTKYEEILIGNDELAKSMVQKHREAPVKNDDDAISSLRKTIAEFALENYRLEKDLEVTRNNLAFFKSLRSSTQEHSQQSIQTSNIKNNGSRNQF